jgi:hypothetical protein
LASSTAEETCGTTIPIMIASTAITISISTSENARRGREACIGMECRERFIASGKAILVQAPRRN